MSGPRDSRTGFVADTLSFSSVDGPGNRFVVFLQGCNFDCIACHNPQTIPGHGPIEGHHPTHQTVEELLVEIRRAAPFISGVTVSGGEATQQWPFVLDLFTVIHADPSLTALTCFVDSNGACDLSVWDDLAPVMDGAMIDLKCLDDAIHREMTGESNVPVLASIEHLQALGRLHEVRLLLLADVNDDEHILRRTAEWLARLDRHMRVTLIGFRGHGVRLHDPPLIEPTPDRMRAAASTLAEVAPFDITVV